MEQSNKCYIFKGILDAFAYLVISAIIPVTYLVVDFIAVSSGDAITLIAALLALLSFFASCSYDYISRYNEDDENEEKKPYIYHVLLIGCGVYAVGSILILISIILVTISTVNIEDFKLAYNLLFYAGLYAPIVSFIEVCRRVYKKHRQKTARARGT